MFTGRIEREIYTQPLFNGHMHVLLHHIAHMCLRRGVAYAWHASKWSSASDSICLSVLAALTPCISRALRPDADKCILPTEYMSLVLTVSARFGLLFSDNFNCQMYNEEFF